MRSLNINSFVVGNSGLKLKTEPSLLSLSYLIFRVGKDQKFLTDGAGAEMFCCGEMARLLFHPITRSSPSST